MSYSRSYQGVVSKTVSVPYSYPASQSGGSSSTSVTVDIPVTIGIDVDTNPFDHSVDSCKGNVNLLTGSIVATESAHIAAKVLSSKKISESIVTGFFGLIKSEINQQLTELKPRVDALLIELVQHQQNCVSKKQQFEGDFARISERYTKIFFDLDKELKNRILSLNQSAVGIHAKLTTHVHRAFSDISTGISTVHNKEGGNLQASISAAGLKQKALSMIGSAKNYLFTEKNLSKQLNEILFPLESRNVNNIYTPILYFEIRNKANGNDGLAISPENISSLKENENKLTKLFTDTNTNWNTLSIKARENINTYLQLELRNDAKEKSAIHPRVAQQLMKLWTSNTDIKSNL